MRLTFRVSALVLGFLTRCVLSGVDSPYTKILQRLQQEWPLPAVRMQVLDGKAAQFRVFETPGNIDYIGTEIDVSIAAPLSVVETVFEDTDHYVELLPGFEEIKKTVIDKNKFEIFWEKNIPVFFIANVKYTVTYSVDREKLERRFYIGQLKERKGLKALDSLQVLEKSGEGVRYYECAFFDGDFGIITSLAPGKIWRESVEAVIHGALAKKLKSEKPELKYDEIQTLVSAEVKTYPVEQLVEKRKPHPYLRVKYSSKGPTK